MNFIIRKVSDYYYAEKREFNSLEEIMTFKEEVGYDLIITDAYDAEVEEHRLALLIYDDYIE